MQVNIKISWPAVWLNTRDSVAIRKGIVKAIYKLIAPWLLAVPVAFPVRSSAQSIVYPAQLVFSVGTPGSFTPVSSGILPFGYYADREIGPATSIILGLHGIAVDSAGIIYDGRSVHEIGYYFY